MLFGPLAILVSAIVIVELVYRKWQFSVRGLLITMTFIAVALGVFAAGRLFGQRDDQRRAENSRRRSFAFANHNV